MWFVAKSSRSSCEQLWDKNKVRRKHHRVYPVYTQAVVRLGCWEVDLNAQCNSLSVKTITKDCVESLRKSQAPGDYNCFKPLFWGNETSGKGEELGLLLTFVLVVFLKRKTSIKLFQLFEVEVPNSPGKCALHRCWPRCQFKPWNDTSVFNAYIFILQMQISLHYIKKSHNNRKQLQSCCGK